MNYLISNKMLSSESISEVERFSLLYKNSFDKVCNFACFYVRNKQASEDITMDSFLKLFETMKEEPVDNPMALLITIVKHKSLDYLKLQLRRRDTEDNIMQWKQRELSIRISNLENCNPDDIFSSEIRSIVMKTLISRKSAGKFWNLRIGSEFLMNRSLGLDSPCRDLFLLTDSL